MNDAFLAIALALCGGASFFFSGIETGIYALNRVRLRLKAERGEPSAVRMQDMVRRPQLLISTILIGNHVANYAASYCSAALIESRLHVGGAELDLLNTLVLTPFLFVFGEITPKNVFRIRAEGIVYRASRLMWFAFVVFHPLALLLRWLGRLSRALPTATPSPDAMLGRDRLESLMGEMVEDGVLTSEQSRMVRNVMRISTVPVSAAMVPLDLTDTVDAGFGREELIAASKRNRRTRLPVRDPDSGKLIGVVNVLDLVFRGKDAAPDLVVTVPSLPESHPVDRALTTLRRVRRTMAFVTDGHDRIVGIVTVKDLVEEISGELPVF